MRFDLLFKYHNIEKEEFMDLYNICRQTFHNWKKSNKVSLRGQLKAQILTDGKFKASEEALKRG